MRTIYKYLLTEDYFPEAELPEGAEILSFNKNKDGLCIWAMVDTGNKPVYRKFRLVATGQQMELNDNCNYIGAVHDYCGGLVFHLFEVP